MAVTVYSIGHSTHSLDEFLAMLQSQRIETVIDVRTVPGSRHNPQYGQKELGASLPEHGLRYLWMKSLGGLRHTTKASQNLGWRNASFRGYADYMQTPEFDRAIDELISLATERTVVIMCAEAVPWRCHRSLIGDALLVRGIGVIDIMSTTSAKLHELTSFAHVDGTRISYPALPEDTAENSVDPEPK